MKLNKLLLVSMLLALPVFAAEGVPGATINKDGAKPSRGAISEMCKADPEKCRQQHQARAAEHFKKSDADGNGSLSRAEAEKDMPRLARHFDMIDTHKDGQLSPEELSAARKAHQGAKAPGKS